MQRPQPTQRSWSIAATCTVRAAPLASSRSRVPSNEIALCAQIFFAGTAANAVLGRDVRLAGGMLLHLAGTAAASHTQVLHGAAKAGLLMAP